MKTILWFLVISAQQCGNFRNSLLRIFGKNFVKATFLLKKWFDEIFFRWDQSKFFISTNTQWGNCWNLVSRTFGKNFVKVTFLLKKLLKSWFDEILFGETKFFIFPHRETQSSEYGKLKIYCHPKKISSNQHLSIFFSKSVTFTKFLSKKCDIDSKFPQFSHCATQWFCTQKFREVNDFMRSSFLPWFLTKIPWNQSH